MALDPEFLEPTENIDGVGNNRLMAGTSHNISLGTASLLMMGLTNRVSGTSRAVSSQANGMPETMRLMANSSPSKSGHIAHTVEVPMVVNISSERCYDVLTLRDEEAQEHGFATAKAWRKELGLKKDQPATIYSYPVTLTASSELPHDRDRAGSRLNAVMDAAYDAWRSGGDKSIKRARQYLETQPEETKIQAFQRIAPYKALNGENRIEWLSAKGKRLLSEGASLEELHAHQLPSDVRAQRIFEPELTPEPAVEKSPRPKRGGSVKLTEGNGWNLHQHDLPPADKPTDATKADKPAKNEKPTSVIAKKVERQDRVRVRGIRQSAVSRHAMVGINDSADRLSDRLTARLRHEIDASESEAKRIGRKRRSHVADENGQENDEPLKSPRSR